MNACEYCANGPEPGWIETDNNGPIVPCPVCNTAKYRLALYTARENALMDEIEAKLAKETSNAHR